MTDAHVLDAHPELIAARRAVAHAPEKLGKLVAIQREALRLAPLIASGAIPRGEAVDCLKDVGRAYGLCITGRERETVEHVIGEGLAGRSAGVRPVPPGDNGAAMPQPRIGLQPLDLAEFLRLRIAAAAPHLGALAQ